MPAYFQRVVHFISSYPGILYSLSLLIIIPAVLYYNTFFVTSSFQNTIDSNLQSQALVMENIMGVFVTDFLENEELLQQKVQQISTQNKDLAGIRVLKAQADGGFQVIASHQSGEIGYAANDTALTIAFSQGQTIANLQVSAQGERIWSVIQPLRKTDSTEKIGLLTLEFSLAKVDQLIAQTLFNSYLIVVLAMVLTLLLIVHHTRLFEYVALSVRLKELDQMKDNFIRMATHELQSPIINIRGHLQALQEQIGGQLTTEQQELFWRANISAKNMGELVADILEVARIEQGRLDFSLSLFDPALVINEVLAELELRAKEKNILLSSSLPAGSYFIKANKNRLHQVLVNLINNALKYTLEGEVRLQVSADSAHKRYTIAVQDTGLGISAEAQKRLFERFYRVKTKQTADIPGTGLGLWICKELCERMGGKIFVESLEGVGTKFSVMFDLAK